MKRQPLDAYGPGGREGAVGAVLLAAGAASRYGGPKQLAHIEGISLVRRMALAVLETGAELVVVTGAHADVVARELAGMPATIVYNAQWEDGMGSSIARGFRHLLDRSPPPDAALLCLVDQALVGVVQLQRLLAAHRTAPSRIIASNHSAIQGPPCLFPVSFYPELAHLSGAAGARRLLEKYRTQVTAIAMPEAAVDIDSPDDYARVPILLGTPGRRSSTGPDSSGDFNDELADQR